MLSTPALARVSLGAAAAVGCERMERDAPVTPETLLALLLRPEADKLETGSVKGIVPPFEACVLVSDEREQVTKMSYPTGTGVIMKDGVLALLLVSEEMGEEVEDGKQIEREKVQ